METRPTVHRALEVAVRPAALVVAVLSFLIAAGFGTGAFDAQQVGAQPALTFDGSCTPDSVRPDELALLRCTVVITNEGTETATSLVSNLGPASACNIPSPLPTFIDRLVNGEPVSTAPLELSFTIGDLAPGATFETITRLVVRNSSTGLVGGQVTVSSRDTPGVSVTGQTCWEVTADAAAPPTNLQVTKTLLSEIVVPELVPLPPPPPPTDGDVVISSPSNGDIVTIEPVPVLPGPFVDQAEFEIIVTNVSGANMTNVTVLDVETGIAVLVSAEPPASGTDPLGRPTWDVGVLAPSEEFRILVTYGPPPDGNCAFADDVVVVTATPDGGEPEDYVAFADSGVSVGACVFIEPNFCEHFPPGDGFSVFAPCDEKVWWSAPPGGGAYQPVFNPIPSEEYCWFIPPADGDPVRSEGPVLQPCAEPICWISFGPGGEVGFLGQVPCDFQFCQYTAPDGSTSFQETCDFPVCWSSPPEGSEWQPIFGCGQFEEQCWFSLPGDGGPSQLGSCEFPLRFAVSPPPGAVDFGFGPQPVYFDEDACWPVPPDGGEFFTFPVPCSEIDSIRWFIPSDGGPAFPNFFGEEPVCWAPVPPDDELPPGAELPPDLLIPEPCLPGEEGTTGVPGGSVPAEVVEAVSTPVEIVEGTVEKLEPLASSGVLPAELVPSARVEPASDGDFGRGGPGDEMLVVPDASALDDIGAPQSGGGAANEGGSTWPWALTVGLAAAGLLLTAAARMRRRRSL